MYLPFAHKLKFMVVKPQIKCMSDKIFEECKQYIHKILVHLTKYLLHRIFLLPMNLYCVYYLSKTKKQVEKAQKTPF